LKKDFLTLKENIKTLRSKEYIFISSSKVTSSSGLILGIDHFTVKILKLHHKTPVSKPVFVRVDQKKSPLEGKR
jgi:hypothetical protein